MYLIKDIQDIHGNNVMRKQALCVIALLFLTLLGLVTMARPVRGHRRNF
jgi:hypothetical protein